MNADLESSVVFPPCLSIKGAQRNHIGKSVVLTQIKSQARILPGLLLTALSSMEDLISFI